MTAIVRGVEMGRDSDFACRYQRKEQNAVTEESHTGEY